jgi:hypothetical protein
MRHKSSHSRNGSSGTNVLGFSARRSLTARRQLLVELPEFLILFLEQRAAEANQDSVEEEVVDISEVVEYQLAGMLSIQEVAELELKIPGYSLAVRHWLRVAGE